MFKKIKNFLLTDLGGATTNGTAAVIWFVLGASGSNAVFHWLGGLNALLFGAMAGVKLSDHFSNSTIRMLRDALDAQQRIIMALAEAREADKLEDDIEVS